MPNLAKTALIVDAGPLFAYINGKDKHHERCVELLDNHDGELLITPYVLTEACYLVQTRVSAEAEISLLEEVVYGQLEQVSLDDHDMSRVLELTRLYRDFPLGVTDASVIALAERRRISRIATIDHADFRRVKPAHASHFDLVPEL